MSFFKKFFIIFVSINITLCFSSCKKAENSNIILTSFYPVYIIAQIITENTDIQLKNMAHPQTGCLHDYQLTSTDMRLINDASVLIINGAGMENDFMQKAIDNSNIKIIDSSNGLFKNNDDINSNNSHIWTSLDMVKTQAENICDGLKQIYPHYSDTLENNKANFIKSVDKIEKLQNTKPFKAISFNEAFYYMLTENGIDITAEIEIDENVTPTARQMADISNLAKNSDIDAIFCADDNGIVFANTLSRETGIPVYILDPLTYTNSSNDYISAMKNNISIISEAKNK